jgi:Bifunctional DNA primase/polymerase, N-terminal
MPYPFERLPNAMQIIEGLNDIPDSWSLTPVWEKSPKRKNWQTENKLDIGAIASLIFDGESKISKQGREYQYFASGFGIRTGDYSNGLIAIDVDGNSAKPIFNKMSGGNYYKTVSWTSGKEGRLQMLYKIPDSMRSQLKSFSRRLINSWQGLECKKEEDGKYTEGLEFRYNGVQSVLPPSLHPTTGSYKWIYSPNQIEVAIAPQWLLDILLVFAKETAAIGSTPNWEQYKKVVAKGLQPHRDLKDFLYYDIMPRLSPDQIFSWSGHDFRQVGKTLKGNPPWRQSASGTSFHAWIGSDGQWAWQDKQTGEGGGAIAYRHKLQGGSGKPRGKAFVDIVRSLAQDAGLEMPKYVPDQIAIASTAIILDESQKEIAIANADILRSCVTEYGENPAEKRAMIQALTEQWTPQIKTQVWALLEPEFKTQIKILLSSGTKKKTVP